MRNISKTTIKTLLAAVFMLTLAIAFPVTSHAADKEFGNFLKTHDVSDEKEYSSSYYARYTDSKNVTHYKYTVINSIYEINDKDKILYVSNDPNYNGDGKNDCGLVRGIWQIWDEEDGKLMLSKVRKLVIREGVKTINKDNEYRVTLGTYGGIGRMIPNITEIVFPDSLTHIGNYTFSFCYNLKEINLPGNVKSIGVGAFADGKWKTGTHKKLVLPEGLEKIGSYAFSNSYFDNVYMPASITQIGYAVFSSTGMTGTNYEEKVESVSYEKMYYAGTKASWDRVKKAKGDVIKPTSYGKIDTTKKTSDMTDSKTDSKTSTVLKKGSTFKVKNATYKVLSGKNVSATITADGKNSLTIPQTVTYKKTKYKVTTVTKVSGKKVKAVTKIVIPKTTTKISKNAFKLLTGVKTVVIKDASTLKTVEKGAFNNINKKAVVKVYAKTKKQYNAAVKKLKKSTNRKNVTYTWMKQK